MSKLEISPEILAALQSLSSMLEVDDVFERTLRTVVDLSVTTIPGCDAAGVTVRSQGDSKTAAASDQYTLVIDQIQYDTNEGPCLMALETGVGQRIEAISEESRWPAFSPRARKEGLGSSASFPLRMNSTRGALNLYARTERAFDDNAMKIAEVFAHQAGIALHNAHLYQLARDLGDQLTEALKTRDLIGQAKGILMEREGVTDEEAFEMLKTISQTTNVKLREVAQRVISTKLDEGAPPRHLEAS